MYNEISKVQSVLSELLEKLQARKIVMLSDVLNDYINQRACVLSQSTLRDYGLTFRRFVDFIPPETDFKEITPNQIRSFLNTIPGGKKNHQNAYIALCALWTFAIEQNLACVHTPRSVRIAKPEQRAIIPFSFGEVNRLLQAASEGRSPYRDQAIIMTLLDTGIRASELCALRVDDLRGDFYRVFGKGSKERMLPVSEQTQVAINVYLSKRKGLKRNDRLFVSERLGTFTRDALRQLIERIGIRAGVNGAHPHRFRHTFAMTYLMNGGDAYTLQQILGHSTMDMVKRYLHLTNRDIHTAHNRASPIVRWGIIGIDPCGQDTDQQPQISGL